MHLAQELLKNIQSSDGPSFVKETRALKMGAVASHRKLTTTNWQAYQSCFSYNHTRSCRRTQCLPFCVSQLLEQTVTVQSLDKGVPHELTTNPKTFALKCPLLLFYATTMNHFSIRLWWATKSGFYTTTNDNKLSGWPETKPQSTSRSQTCSKERSWPLSGGLLPVWYTVAFWIPEKSLYLRSMLSKPMRYTENYEVCSRHWSTEWAQFSSVMMPSTTNTSKVEQIGLRSFASPAYSSDLLSTTTSSSIWKNLYLLLSFAVNLKLF